MKPDAKTEELIRETIDAVWDACERMSDIGVAAAVRHLAESAYQEGREDEARDRL